MTGPGFLNCRRSLSVEGIEDMKEMKESIREGTAVLTSLFWLNCQVSSGDLTEANQQHVYKDMFSHKVFTVVNQVSCNNS